MAKKEEIQGAYQLTGGHTSFYDHMMTCSTFLGKIICHFVWNMDREKNRKYIRQALSGIPKNFSGKILEIPVGTGVLTMPKYKKLPDAEITCVDYLPDMMESAQEKAERMGIRNIHFLQGDVGNLPFADDSFDIVLSMNEFHVFPDKNAAYKEVFRVLKSGGVFCGCFYTKDGCKRTDWFARHIYVPRGFFTPPFETESSLRRRLLKTCKEVLVTRVESVACFRCIKK